MAAEGSQTEELKTCLLGCVTSHKTSLPYDIPLPKTILIPKIWKKIQNFQKPSGAWDLKILKMHGEVKKSKSENRIRLGPIICKMMRGFQIWPQNSNPITFDPLFGQKTVESRDFWKNPQKIFRDSSFLAKKGVKFYPISILRPDSESSRQSTYHRLPFDIIFKFWIFDLPMHFQNFQISGAAQFFEISHFLPHFR